MFNIYLILNYFLGYVGYMCIEWSSSTGRNYWTMDHEIRVMLSYMNDFNHHVLLNLSLIESMSVWKIEKSRLLSNMPCNKLLNQLNQFWNRQTNSPWEIFMKRLARNLIGTDRIMTRKDFLNTVFITITYTIAKRRLLAWLVLSKHLMER